MSYFILDGHTPVAARDVLEWAKWFEDNDRRVAQTVLADGEVSTIFLGFDHTLFETLVFGGNLDGERERYATWDDAAEGHEDIVRRVRQAGAEKAK